MKFQAILPPEALSSGSESDPSLLPRRRDLLAQLHARQRLRRQLRAPSGYRFLFADAISMVDGAQWDALVAGHSFFLQRPYLQMLEDFGPENVELRYVMIYARIGALWQAQAALVLQIVTVHGRQFGGTGTAPQQKLRKRELPLALLKKALAPAAKSLQQGLRERVLVCGNLLTYGFHGIAFKNGTDPAPIWPAIAEALYRIRRAEKISGQTDFILIKDLRRQELPASHILSQLSYRALETEPNMVLKIAPEWKNHEHYLASLHSKYRSAVRQQILKPIEAGACVLEHLTDLEPEAARLHELYMAVHEQAGMRLFTLPQEYFPALAETAGANMLCSVIRREGQILGFIITLKEGTGGLGYHIGYDKQAARDLPLYLRLLHASIDDACRLGCDSLSLGRTALEPKARLGAQPEPLTVWMRHRQPVMNMLVKRVLGMVPHEEAPERNPFKNQDKKQEG